VTPVNDPHSIETPAGLRITFDDHKKTITIHTPANNQIVLSDDAKSITIHDQSGNKVQMTAGGITLDSASDVTIKAGGNISISAVGNISTQAAGDLTMGGVNVSCAAQSAFTATGNITATLSASGETIVKGAIVAIN